MRTAIQEQDDQVLYQAELALHDAHSSGVDTWIRAASDRLHQVLNCQAEAKTHLVLQAQP